MKHAGGQTGTGFRGQQGYALLSVFLLLGIVGGLAGAGLLGTRLALQSTANLISANDAFYAAESGLLHGLSVINSRGVISFQTDIVERWGSPNLFGGQVKQMPGNPNVRYQVAVAASEATPDDEGVLTVRGYAADLAQRTVEARLCKGSFLPTGAIHILRKSSCGTFRGSTFRIDGNDHRRDGTLCTGSPAPGDACEPEPVPGISTADAETAKCVREALSEQQEDNVRGVGGDPSVVKIGGPLGADLAALLENVLANPNVVTTSAQRFNDNTTLGTYETPQITRMTYEGTVTVSGRTSGVGILVADHGLSLGGDVDFTGWIITGDELSVLGNVAVLGSIWTGAFSMIAGGSMNVEYCTSCLDLIDGLPGTRGGNFPRLMKVCGWSES
jgi:hypothetical protein